VSYQISGITYVVPSLMPSLLSACINDLISCGIRTAAGNYDQFVVTKSEKQEEQEKRYKAEQDQIKHMKDYVAKFGQGMRADKA
jgi:ATPase subunit of ABC transporter with duplicated ATPase domains